MSEELQGIIEEVAIDAITEEVATEEVSETLSPTEEVVAEEITEELQKDFDPDELDFEVDEEELEAEKYNISGYDLRAYAEVLNFEDAEAVEIIKTTAEQLKQKGFSQRDVEVYIQAKLEEFSKDEDDTLDAKYVKEKLNSQLSREEKANYKAVGGMLKDLVKGTEFEGDAVREIMSNPKLVKLLNLMYKQSISKNGNVVKEVKAQTPKIQLDVRQAMEHVQSKIKEGMDDASLSKHVNSLKDKIKKEDLASFEEIMKSVIK